MKALERRLAEIELKLTLSHAGPMVIIIEGGLFQGDPTFARSDVVSWLRAPNESFPDFKARVIASQEVEGQEVIVFGGLPDRD